MKRTLTSLTILLIFNLASYSQGLHLGLKVGTDVQKINGVSFTDQFSFGYHIGGLIEVKLSKKLSIQPEIYFSETRLQTANTPSSVYNNIDPFKIRLSYFNMPLLLNLKAAKFFVFQFGPKYGILSNKQSNLPQNAALALKSGDLSAVAGVQIHLPKIRIYARYQIGLNNINDLAEQEKWQNQVIHAGVGLLLF